MQGLDYVQVVNSDNTESRYYLKRSESTFIVTVIRKYIRLFVPMLFAVLGIRFILPFVSDGPIFLVSLQNQFLIPCEGTWLLNLTFLQNYFEWGSKYDSSTCFPFSSDSGAINPDNGLPYSNVQ